MVVLDYILLLLIIGFAILGFRRGFLSVLGSLFGLIIAVLVASRFYLPIAHWFSDTNFAKAVAFVLLFLITIKLVSLLFWIVGKVFQVVTVLPFISGLDKTLGLVLGMVEGIFVLSVLLYFLAKYPINDWFTLQISISVVSGVLLKLVVIFVPFFPEALTKLKSYI
ncbi:CvpA family protein [Patescibacteria group bacterium]|nr:CvpA family protein [Patescibacteria group bacterium]